MFETGELICGRISETVEFSRCKMFQIVELTCGGMSETEVLACRGLNI